MNDYLFNNVLGNAWGRAMTILNAVAAIHMQEHLNNVVHTLKSAWRRNRCVARQRQLRWPIRICNKAKYTLGFLVPIKYLLSRACVRVLWKAATALNTACSHSSLFCL